MEENQKPKRKLLDKILMGVVIGGAVGSVIGAGIYQKRKMDREKEKEEIIEEINKKEGRAHKLLNAVKKRMFKKWRQEDEEVELPNEMEIK